MFDLAEPALEPAQWQARADAYRLRLDAFLAPKLQRIAAGDPVPKFLFSYYSLRPRQLRRWNPGFGVAMAGAAAVRGYADRRDYRVTDGRVEVAENFLRERAETVSFIARLLRATAGRPAQLNCFGLHEWAMLYRGDEVRHDHVPLRMTRAELDQVVEATPLRCTHFDAFRFFTPAAAPRNAGTPHRATQIDWEQPGCLHANMDLYKWCYKLGPLIDSDLLLDCLELAAAAREIDMRASPYDLSGYGYSPITVENTTGRAEYVRCQSAIVQRATPLRAALLERCDQLLAFAGCE
ncbi:3-methyladenine DNA glycosylase [[Mycobacterium] crassicus]|uniref:3-methyladenine DNA glycosylase n=1 Tax=[Mycobacterium] crassicus TaxID=2872309 RepID=A0ABU5XRE9_9MYCO|nr:3-methyladenine DNA glycosylase [Mycolicibacter sp. MYC098]MEB3023882.1 3-methyladenine DNA glycosylase [Mycolicibacter sp. MYC098]